jgi:hypothetical protein
MKARKKCGLHFSKKIIPLQESDRNKIPLTGSVGGYRWGPERKEKLLALEKHKGLF